MECQERREQVFPQVINTINFSLPLGTSVSNELATRITQLHQLSKQLLFIGFGAIFL